MARTCTLHVPASDGRPRDPVCIEWDKVHLIETNLHRQSTEEKKEKKAQTLSLSLAVKAAAAAAAAAQGSFVILRLIYALTAGFDFTPFFVTTFLPV